METAENFLKLQHPTTRLSPTEVKTKDNRPEKKKCRRYSPWLLVCIWRGHRLRTGNTCRAVMRSALPSVTIA